MFLARTLRKKLKRLFHRREVNNALTGSVQPNSADHVPTSQTTSPDAPKGAPAPQATSPEALQCPVHFPDPLISSLDRDAPSSPSDVLTPHVSSLDAPPSVANTPTAVVTPPDSPPNLAESNEPNPPGPEDTKDLDKTDGADTVLEGIMAHAQDNFDKYQDSTAARIANKSDVIIDTMEQDVSDTQQLASPVKSIYQSDAMKVVRDSVNSLVEILPGFVGGLLQIAGTVHPFIGAAVKAFQVVAKLNAQRCINDKKIGVLLLQMKDMMEALQLLRRINQDQLKDSGCDDGVSVKERMENLLRQTEVDIRNCGNACDTYSKKRLVVKVLQSTAWDETLKPYIETFAKRGQDFTQTLSFCVVLTVDLANRKLDSLTLKLDTFFAFFMNAVTHDYKQLAAFVREKGGPEEVMKKDKVLREVMTYEPTSAATASNTKRAGRDLATTSNWNDADGDIPQYGSQRQPGQDDVEALKTELLQPPKTAIEYNLVLFMNKIALQQKELADEFGRVVHHEGDRIIEAVSTGSFARILDPEIQTIWKEMQWSGHVKARHFVLVVRDYYRQRDNYRQRRRNEQRQSLVEGVEDHHTAPVGDDSSDQWALEWVDIGRLPSIAEAFDGDASGFITVAEVNQFTTARHDGWSLPHWLAYWAIGWQIGATYYRDKINNLLSKMFSLQPLLHPVNAKSAERYLRTVYKRVYTLTCSLVGTYESEALRARFKDYIEAEEKSLRIGLQTIGYQIEARDTLTLITGPDRIEKRLFPLLYLLLKRDFEIFSLGREWQLDRNELLDSANMISRVFEAVDSRHDELEMIFKQRSLNPAQQFKIHANELFDYWHDGTKFWSLEHLRQRGHWRYRSYDDEEEDQNLDPSKILHYQTSAAYDGEKEKDSESSTIVANDGTATIGEFSNPVAEHHALCDACRNSIFGTRLMCLKCGSHWTLDFCDKRACRDTVMTRDDITEPHQPTHDFVKVRRAFNQYREIGMILRQSDVGLARARALLKEHGQEQASAPTDQKDEGETRLMKTDHHEPASITSNPHGHFLCISCSKVVSYECWYCVDCPEVARADVFICQGCDEKGGVSKGTHKATHSLVLCKAKEEAAPNTGRQLSALECQIATLSMQIQKLTDSVSYLARHDDLKM